MTSAINTGTINVNYPTPGVNNSSQGMRDNFAGTKDNLEIAKTELTDLQNNVLLKAALSGQVLNNDMANGLIKNAQTLGFRASTYNLGTNSGTLNIDLTLGDVQYGVLASNTSLTFSKWAPTNTQSSVQVILTVTPGQVITLPTSVSLGTATIEGLSGSAITVPAGVTQLHWQFNTIDCGTTIEIVPVNRPRVATQTALSGIPATANVPATGTITASTATPAITGVGTLFTTELVVGRVLLTSANVVIGTVQSITNDTSLTLVTASLVNVTVGSPFKQISPVGVSGDVAGSFKTSGDYIYVCTGNYDGITAIWKRTLLNSY